LEEKVKKSFYVFVVLVIIIASGISSIITISITSSITRNVAIESFKGFIDKAKEISIETVNINMEAIEERISDTSEHHAEVVADRVAYKTAREVLVQELGVEKSVILGGHAVTYVTVGKLTLVKEINIKTKNNFSIKFEKTTLHFKAADMKDDELPYACRDGVYIYQFWVYEGDFVSTSFMEEVIKQYY